MNHHRVGAVNGEKKNRISYLLNWNIVRKRSGNITVFVLTVKAFGRRFSSTPVNYRATFETNIL